MPPLIRKILVVAAADGLILQPHRQQKPGPSVQIKYATQDISSITTQESEDAPSLEAHGVIGLLRLASSAYLVALTSREQVAQIKDKPVFTVTGVSLIPLSSQAAAISAIDQSNRGPKEARKASASKEPHDDASDEEVVHSGNVTADEDATENLSPSEDPEVEPPAPTTVSSKIKDQGSSIAQDVLRRKGQYGRFAERWFSKKGWASDKRRVSMNLTDKAPEVASDAPVPEDAIAETPTNLDGAQESKLTNTSNKSVDTVQGDSSIDPSVVLALLPKLERTTKLLFNSRSFFFSYDYDLTRRLGNESNTKSDVPLHGRVDPLYFWNQALSRPLIDAGQHAYVLPLMQGFVGQKAFTIDTAAKEGQDSVSNVKDDVGEIIELQETANAQSDASKPSSKKELLLTLISRRSVKRAGLRYLRRGADESGHVANGVETEQILSDPSWGTAFGVYSFTQIRGSIPLFFTQSPYSFKPAPTLQHSLSANHRAFVKHFSNLRERYGLVQVASLVEKGGPEATVGNSFTAHAESYNAELPSGTPPIGYEWFDFHKICAGMRFDKVSVLLETLQPTLESYGFSVERNGKVEKKQAGVLRTNCMDCLDRTNVVQSATASWALEAQLASENISLDLRGDNTTHWFNSLWADNGDAISKQYSSTAALKGDYTRTRKRDYRGAINDFGLTLTRYYNNIVNDYFSQTVIDYLLGNVTAQVFEEFEDNMMTADPSVSMRTIRQNAIDVSAKIVIADPSEELAGGWTVSTPATSNTLRTLPLREIVLLITDAALYAVRFDWNTEKVASFERIDLRRITRARQGTYITSTFTPAQLDPQRNVGVVITYRPGGENLVRHNTRSMSTVVVPKMLRRGEPATAASDVHDAQDASENNPPAAATQPDATVPLAPPLTKPKDDLHLLAFKALPARTSIASSALRDDAAGPLPSEQELIADICAHLVKAVAPEGTGQDQGQDQTKDQAHWIEHADIIGVQEAKRSTGLLETLGHSIKKMVWA